MLHTRRVDPKVSDRIGTTAWHNLPLGAKTHRSIASTCNGHDQIKAIGIQCLAHGTARGIGKTEYGPERTHSKHGVIKTQLLNARNRIDLTACKMGECELAWIACYIDPVIGTIASKDRHIHRARFCTAKAIGSRRIATTVQVISTCPRGNRICACTTQDVIIPRRTKDRLG